MSSLRFDARRSASALLIASVTIIGPVGVAALVGSSDIQYIADPAGCSVNSSQGDHSLSCTPGNASTKGAPSERDLTNENSNVDYGPRR
jgi:hypothetical protein